MRTVLHWRAAFTMRPAKDSRFVWLGGSVLSVSALDDWSPSVPESVKQAECDLLEEERGSWRTRTTGGSGRVESYPSFWRVASFKHTPLLWWARG